MASKTSLLTQFLQETVSITLDSKTAIQLDTGEVVDVQTITDGTFLDFDDEFVLIGQEGKDSVELINRKLILSVRLLDLNEIVSNEPRPPKGDMC